MQGKTIAILESRLGKQMVEWVGKRGARVLHAPAPKEVPGLEPSSVERLVAALESNPESRHASPSAKNLR